jgi:serine/threonine protein phosphatase PrpC
VPVAEAIPVAAEAAAPAPLAETGTPLEAPGLSEAAPLAEPLTAPPAAPVTCPICGSAQSSGSRYCADCGYFFEASPPATALPSTATSAAARVHERYELVRLLSERGGISRWEARDLSQNPPQPVILVRQQRVAAVAEIVEPPAATPAEDTEEILPTFDGPGQATLPMALPTPSNFGLDWERRLLEPGHPSLPQVREKFSEGEFDYLVEELPTGRSLWDAWDDPEADAALRYGWLKQIAEGLHHLHQGGALLEGLCPDDLLVDDHGQARIANLSGLLPFPVPEGTPIRGNLYTAPELLLSPQQADARADLYSFGAIIYSLEYLHHSLEEKDFAGPFQPHLITDRYPDAHPALCRLINKTFCRDIHTRFPTDEAGKSDPTGFQELIQTLEVCRRTFDLPRMDIAAWTTIGMVRSGNEDAFAFLHAVQGTQDDVAEYALILLCDGMGGYEAGEVAAALAIREMRQFLLAQPLFAALAGQEPPPPGTFSVPACMEALKAALQHANQVVYAAARAPGSKRRGMGCTAEIVYVDPQHLVVGHVGDSRTYHLSRGRLRQLTRDQTLVNRLVELGQLTPEEAENHPRKNELQQAIGGQPVVEPGLYSARLARGDWVLVCSDGLTNHIPPADLEVMLLRETAYSAEEAARRLINLVNLRGATDNATVALVRLS